MSYTDEKMIKAMNAHKEGVQGSIEEGISIREELYTFDKTQLFDGRMQVMLPQTFKDMPIELARLKYPMEQRPQVIRTNDRPDRRHKADGLHDMHPHVPERGDALRGAA